MKDPDILIYLVHVAFWAAFGITRALLAERAEPESAAPAASEEKTAPWSRALLTFHMLGFGVLYFGLGNAVFGKMVPLWFPGQRIVGTFVMALGSALMCWSLVSFRSWRFRAKLDAGHQLATEGAFRLMRHPIYMGLNLLGIGTAIWAPHPIVCAGAVLMIIGSDLRARSEEKLLESAFGAAYRDYRARTRRFLPGLY
jgi:protein-S-isoprenylcysteine O-methyltransferase Ste14